MTGKTTGGKAMNLSSTSISVSIANFRVQALTSLINSGDEAQGSSFGDIFSSLTGSGTGGASSATGRNLSLFDPESAYQMMTDINGREVKYKAQYAELNAIENYLPKIEQAGADLSGVDGADSTEAILAKVQSFIDQYNDWTERFRPDVQPGGVLQGTQAAEVSLYELEASVKNIFIGASDGFRGLADLGISIDPGTHKLSLDSAKLSAVLASDKQGAVDALDDFSANFAKSADLLASDGNFIRNRLDNLDRAIHYIGDHIAAWRQEFGTGDAAKPSGAIAKALAAYGAA
jgi:hypothetical protein